MRIRNVHQYAIKTIYFCTLGTDLRISENPCKPHKFCNVRIMVVYVLLSYSWRFSRYSEPIHWLDHGHMTSNNETVSRQIPRAGNIAKTMMSNGKQFTVTREMLTAVTRDRWNLSAVFLFCFCFVLLYNKSLNDWSRGEQ